MASRRRCTRCTGPLLDTWTDARGHRSQPRVSKQNPPHPANLFPAFVATLAPGEQVSTADLCARFVAWARREAPGLPWVRPIWLGRLAAAAPGLRRGKVAGVRGYVVLGPVDGLVAADAALEARIAGMARGPERDALKRQQMGLTGVYVLPAPVSAGP